MKENVLGAVHGQVKRELDVCQRFWLENGIDEKYGGVYTCLDRSGQVYTTDKSVWLQGRCAWTFSNLCNVYGEKPQWRKAAKSCLDFLEDFCINRQQGNRMYFTVTEDGKPLRQRRYCFSEAFYTLGNSEYYALTKEEEHLNRAKAAYDLIWQLNNGLIKDPTGLGPKTIPETRTGRSLADPMIYLNLSLTMAQNDPQNAAFYMERAKSCCETILKYHHKPQLAATLETVGMNGEFQKETTAGRVVNPGHDMECVWFLLTYAHIANDEDVAKKAAEMFEFAFANGWDKKYGGLLYYTDVLGRPPEAYEHDMKLWWPHNELLIASLMLYKTTKEAHYKDIFLQTWEYAMSVFHDEEYGEWYGYLRRDGQPTEPAAKGSTFKGPFHLPRMLIMLDGMLAETEES